MLTESPALDALGDPTRRRIFARLRTRPMAVGELAEGLPVSRPAVSQHLRVLRQAGLVSERPDGTRRIYSVDRAGLSVLRTYLDAFWESALAQFKADAEARQRPEAAPPADTQGAIG